MIVITEKAQRKVDQFFSEKEGVPRSLRVYLLEGG